VSARGGARLERRSLPRALTTAYPRRSKLFVDPAAGLATVEAIFAVTAILGEPRPEVLAAYPWAEEFVRRNRAVLGL
jgi:pre-rRNA-processing protein TSR3